MHLFLPDIHRSAEHREQVEAVEVRDRLAGVEFDGHPFMPLFGPEVAEDARMFDIDMLEDENAHATPHVSDRLRSLHRQTGAVSQ